MVHWKKLAAALLIAGTAGPAATPVRAQDEPADTPKAAPSAPEETEPKSEENDEQPARRDGRHIIIMTPDGRTQRIELPAPVRHRMGKHAADRRWLNALSGEAGPEQAPPKYVIGVGVADVPQVVWAQLDRESQPGVCVMQVMENTPAAAAGLKEGDIILKANDKEIPHQTNLTEIVQEAADKPMQLTLLRAGKEMTVEVTPRENEAATSESMARFGQELPPQLLDYGVHSFGPGVFLQQDPANASDIHKELEDLRSKVEEISRKLDELNAK